ncbi:MAG: hypothetical protein ABFD51_01530, partial [Anaerolineaceae bacterium]
MKSYKGELIAGIMILVISVLACSIPARFAPKSTTATPDITLTAIVAQLYLQATMTAQAPLIIATDTPVPTNTTLPTATTASPTEIPSTPTDIPTSTPVPTKSYEGPNSRSGPSVDAIYLYDEPTIDGVLDEWDMDRFY